MPLIAPRRGRLSPLVVFLMGTALPAAAMAQGGATLNFNGVTGLIDMPSGEMHPDAELTTTFAAFARSGRATLSFQIAPRLQGSFRYSGIKDLQAGNYGIGDIYYDRSFDLRFLALKEGRYWPAVTIGLQDFVGTGLRSGEYIAATKNFAFGGGSALKVTGGIGWGRYGSYNAFAEVGERDSSVAATGGKINFGQWFRGPVAAFGGLEWQVNDKLGLKFEYSSDAYEVEAGQQGLFERKSPVNLGVEYQLSEGVRLGAYYLYGSELGFSAQFALNPRRPAQKGYLGPAPEPLAARPSRASSPEEWSESWAEGPADQVSALLDQRVTEKMVAHGLQLQALKVSANQAEVRVVNGRYESSAQAVGRAARALAGSLPSSVEVFDVVMVANGMPISRTRLRRSDLEGMEYALGGTAALYGAAQITDASLTQPVGMIAAGGTPARFNWGIEPYLRYGIFDPDQPLRVDTGLRATARYQLAPSLRLSGALTQRVAGNMKNVKRESNSVLPHVRTDEYLRARRSTELEHLTLAWFARPGADLYSRLSAGYLERAFAGVSAEVLWKPVDSRLALGVEVNYVKQRSFTSMTGLGDYSVATGHVSAYYDFKNGYHAQVDVGRYLAGDIGATLSLDREFANGWRVGAFATKTNVSAADFGEGSFDKGIRLTIPVAWVTGGPTRPKISATIRPVDRDGGARLNVSDRLYETVREYHQPKLEQQWGRVWR